MVSDLTYINDFIIRCDDNLLVFVCNNLLSKIRYARAAYLSYQS